MFCPNCKSIITKKRINNQIVEFCNCPDKLESNYVSTIEQPKKQRRKKPEINSEGRIINIKEKTRKKFTIIQESIVKEKRLPSEYTNLPLELRISNQARLPSFWKQNQVKQRLVKQIDERYERYYRKIEDFLRETELMLYISFLPNDTLSDFTIDRWGLGFKSTTIKIFYAGTKLNDLASWDSKVLEKEGDVILPYRLFTNYSRKLNFDQLSLGQLLEVLKSDWFKFKDINKNEKISKPTFTELYETLKSSLNN